MTQLSGLPKDSRGYPIPFFVAYEDGEPNFRVADPSKFKRCIENNLCWVCGGKLGQYKAFVIGPMCALNRNTAEPAQHLECAQFSVRTCPFLTKPKTLRVPEEKLGPGHCRPAGISIDRNPGISLIWVTREFKLYHTDYNNRSGILIRVGDPTKLEWYREGRAATRAEVRESIESGLPILMKLAEEQDAEEGGHAAVEDLSKKLEAAMKLLPEN